MRFIGSVGTPASKGAEAVAAPAEGFANPSASPTAWPWTAASPASSPMRAPAEGTLPRRGTRGTLEGALKKKVKSSTVFQSSQKSREGDRSRGRLNISFMTGLNVPPAGLLGPRVVSPHPQAGPPGLAPQPTSHRPAHSALRYFLLSDKAVKRHTNPRYPTRPKDILPSRTSREGCE